MTLTGDEEALRRVQFFGVHDLGAGLYVERVAELVEQFDPESVPTDTADIIELYNVQRYLENDLLPRAYTDAPRALAKTRMPAVRTAVAKFFSTIDETNCASRVSNIPFGYHADLLELLARNKTFERCRSETMLPALALAGVHLGEMLACKKLVDEYDSDMRVELLRSPRNAEHLVRKYLQKDVQGEIHIPSSCDPADARHLLERYIDSSDANPNYVGLIETAPAQVSPAIGIDAKLKLRAKRRNAEITKKFFEKNAGSKTGTEIAISQTQDEPAKSEFDHADGFVARYTYGSRWLEQTCDNPSVLNNFQHLFEFADRQVLLELPSYSALLGALEGSLMTTGKTDYRVGTVFRAVDTRTLLQTHFYRGYLGTKGVDLEEVISWFFETYLVDEFGAQNFSFVPSGSGTSYLQKARHLFAEMEGVAAQFALFVNDGELDRELLVVSGDGVRYKDLPSLLSGKYVYPTDADEITWLLHTLFSDQSSLTYISEELRAESAFRLLLENEVGYDEFHDYQKPIVNELIRLGVLTDTGTRVEFSSDAQCLVLWSLFTTEAASYYHLPAAGRAEADAMVTRGWATLQASLLTEAEGKYFNYFLNNSEFSNGPALRNKYLHGSQPNSDGEDTHFRTYIIALRLTVALVIKINDDFCLWARETAKASD